MLLEGKTHSSVWLNSFNCCFKQKGSRRCKRISVTNSPSGPSIILGAQTVTKGENKNSAGKVPEIHFNTQESDSTLTLPPYSTNSD